MKDLKQSRDTGTRALARREKRIPFGNNLPLPFSLKPDGARTIWKTTARATVLQPVSIEIRAAVSGARN